MRSWWWLFLLAACNGAKADERIELGDADLPNASVDERGIWESAPLSGASWTEYPGHATLVFPHRLGRMPRLVEIYLSFDRDGRGSGLAAGDLARIVVTSDSTLEIRNDTDGDYFVRVVVE